ncbi:MAG: DUF362 domain-containing protein [Candidatus Bathyarchaeota archaeon]|nr:DUF362 domain-containing protein [Candidatus Bathyarchaeota archaeon]
MSFVKVQSQQQLKQAILDSINLIQYKFPTQIRNIAIKPNMCYYWDYSTGQTTDPKFVAALIDVIRDQSPNVNISIIESDASAMKCKYAFKILGYEKLAEKCNVKLVNLSEDKGERVEVSAGGQRFRFVLPETVRKADLRINVPKIKYLLHTKISCALKNIFGCNPNPAKFKYHPRLDETIVALNKIMKFNLCILDGIIVSGSHPRRLGLVMTSQDPVALDVAAAKIAGINPKSVRHITLASKEGLGNISLIPKGTSPKFFEKTYPRKRSADKVMLSAYKLATRTGLLNTEMM